MSEISFGTDGWRAVIADQFTFKNVEIIAQAWADYMIERGQQEKGIAVSYDTRFMSNRFARRLAEVIAGNKITVFLSNTFTPTPVLSFIVKQKRLAAGVMITASHNPFYYNGIKFKDSYGGPVLAEVTERLSRLIYQNNPQKNKVLIDKYLVEDDFLPAYKNHLQSYLNFDLINQGTYCLVYDAMNGAGSGIFKQLLHASRSHLVNLNDAANPLFNYKHPEPIPENLPELISVIKTKKNHLGIATDGDADRFGIIAEDGRFAQLHDLMPLLFQYLIESRGWTGHAVRTTSMADTIDKIAGKYNRKAMEVPVGFKNVTEMMLQQDILLGGEESGGFGFKNHIPERDGILSSLLLLEMLASNKTRLTELIQKLREVYGPFAYGRIDQYEDYNVLQKNLLILRSSAFDSIRGLKIRSVNLIDGIKYYFENDSWMLIRVSQTEPLARIYVGATEQTSVDQLLQAGVELITKK